MQPTESAFDRVKSLLGKMDHSIDEARRRRLEDESPDTTLGGQDEADTFTNTDQASEPHTNGTNGHTQGNGASHTKPIDEPQRPVSKYGRATPIRNSPNEAPAQWRQA